MHKVHEIVNRWQITSDGKTLRVVGASKLDSSTRQYIKTHKGKIISFLQQTPMKQIPANLSIIEPNLKPCPLCKGLNFIHGQNGGYFCINCQPGHKGTSVKAVGKRLETDIKGNATGWNMSEAKHSASVRIIRERQTHPFLVAHKWISQHRLELLGFEWKPAELYRRNKSLGIAWLNIWDKPNLDMFLGRKGEIVFHFKNTVGKNIQQTAFPRRRYGNK